MAGGFSDLRGGLAGGCRSFAGALGAVLLPLWLPLCAHSVTLHDVLPRSGSFAGGTFVTIVGNGFPQPNSHSANGLQTLSDASTAITVLFGTDVCDVQTQMSTETTLICRTRSVAYET